MFTNTGAAVRWSDSTRSLTQRQRRIAALYQGQGLPRVTGAAPRVAVVGAGLAGLAAARLLAKAGCDAQLYEAGDRAGGRIRTEHGRSDPQAVWEMGGEFIDGDHDDMLALADALDVELLDTLPPGEESLSPLFHFGGQRYGDEQLASALASIAPRLAADAGAISSRPGFQAATAADRRFDRLSITDYVDGLKLDRWLQQLIEVSFTTLYGLDAGEQSALNLLTFIGGAPDAGSRILGASDERFKVRSGSQQLTDRLAGDLGERIAFGRRLVRLRRAAAGWVLGFDRGKDQHADAVVLALPFTLLRQVDMGDLLPPPHSLAVRTLGYGTNAKLLLGTHRRIWREQGFDGNCRSDGALQSAWDCSRLRGRGEGVFTVYLGGRSGLALGQEDESTQAARHAALADTLFPGFEAAWTGEMRRACWTDEPLARGSYTCYRPGQWTTLAGVERQPLPGGLYFAGEHCATRSQGYMNGAAETGRAAAMAILKQVAG